MNIELLNETGEVINVINADEEFATLHHGQVGVDWRVAEVQPAASIEQPDPTEWLIDIGPFFDRFGATKMDVLTSTDPTVRAILSDLQVRKWIDLKRAGTAQGLQYVGSVITAVNSTLHNAILNNPVQPEENLALRKLYFS